MKPGNYSKIIIKCAGLVTVFVVGYLTGSGSKDFPGGSGRDIQSTGSEFTDPSKTNSLRSYLPTPDQINADMRQRGLLASNDAADFNSLSDNFEITNYALDIAGIPAARKNDVQAYFDQTQEALEALVISRITVNQAKSDPVLGLYEFDVPAFASDGESLVASLRQSLSEVFGNGAANLLLSGLHPDRRASGFGKFDTKIQILPQKSPIVGQEPQMWKVELRDPKSGKLVRTHNMTTFAEVEKHFGNKLANNILVFAE
jgi:hypothetical protein